MMHKDHSLLAVQYQVNNSGALGPLLLSPHYPREKKGSFLHKYKESHTPKSIKDP